jgi:hypothetical protein
MRQAMKDYTSTVQGAFLCYNGLTSEAEKARQHDDQYRRGLYA